MCGDVGGIARELDRSGRARSGINAVTPLAGIEEDEFGVKSENLIACFTAGCPGDIYDANTGHVLKRELVAEARAEEIRYFEAKQVWLKRQVQEARERTGKPPIL